MNDQESSVPIKVIIFDLGNVIVFVDHMEICESISRWGGSQQDIYQYIFMEGIEEEFDRGALTAHGFFTKLQTRFDLNLDFNHFKHIWSSGFIPNAEIFPVVKSLKSQYRLCLLSNTNQIHFETIQRDMPILSEFEAFFLSFQIGVRKPDPAIFRQVLEYVKVMPEECIYIDDIESFIDAATSLGMNGIVFRNVPDLIKRLGAMGIDRLP